jgi:hypothetical protein
LDDLDEKDIMFEGGAFKEGSLVQYNMIKHGVAELNQFQYA